MSSRQPKWDIYETALLFMAYKRIEEGANIEKEVEKLSSALRMLALQKQLPIDDTYRNINGMKMQLANVQYLFTNGEKGLPRGSVMIHEMYEIYKNTPAEYQRILKEAIRMTGNITTSVQDAFFAYAEEKCGLAPRKLAECLQKAADYCHLKQPLLGMTDVKTVQRVQQQVAEGRLLRFKYGKEAQVIRNVTQHYYNFIKSYRAPKDGVHMPPVFAEDELSTDRDAVAQKETAPNTALTVSIGEVFSAAKKAKGIEQIKATTTEGEKTAKKNSEETTENRDNPREEWIISRLKNLKLVYQDKRNMAGCLWIIGGHELDLFMQECKSHGYDMHYKSDGYKAFPGKAVWWTKNRIVPVQKAEEKTAAINTVDLDAFKQFLQKTQHLTERTANGYCSAIRIIDNALKRNSSGLKLLGSDPDEVQNTIDRLMKTPTFIRVNESRHHQLSAALAQYVVFLRQGGSVTASAKQRIPREKTITEVVFDVLRKAGKPMTVSEIYQTIIQEGLYQFGAQDPQSVVYSKVSLACKQTDVWIKEGRDVLIRSEVDGRKYFQVMSAKEAVAHLQPQQKATKLKTASSWSEYLVVLQQAFPKGFQKESGLDMKKFRKRWAEILGKELEDSDEAVRLQLASHCVDTGKRWYLAELLLSEKDRQTVLNYIDRILSSGKSVLFYSSIYTALEHELESTVLTKDLLISYLRATCQERYILRESYLTNDQNAQVDLFEEIKDVMLVHGKPIHTDELKLALHHLPPDQVERELHIHREFVMDAFHMYFHESMAELTEEELDKIADFIQEELDEQGYMIGDWIQRKLQQLYPEIAERLSFLTLLGVREAVAYKLRDRFTFSGPVITPKGKAMNMIDVFAMYCERRAPFTLEELSAFAKECDSTIYLGTVHQHCTRISEEEFVPNGTVQWNIPHVDAAISLHCTGKYVSLKRIQFFDAFPFVGYPWNSYLLEQYVATVSKEFMLMHSTYAKNTTSGAIVRRDAGFEHFNDVLVDVLVSAPLVLEKAPCLEYLASEGYITRKKLSNIAEIITRAKALRSQKG